MITVTPETFVKVFFDADEIRVAAQAAVALVPGFADSRSVELRVDDERPTTRVAVAGLDPVVLAVESGALEETKRPRTLSPDRTTATVARLLFEVLDRESADFGAPELGEPKRLAAKVAWDVYCYGRVNRLGLSVGEAALRYNFRNRVGFSDRADAAFDRLWQGNALTFNDLVGLSTADD